MFYKVVIPLVLDSQVLVHLSAKALACPVRQKYQLVMPDRTSSCMVVLHKGQKADCDSCKTGIVCAVKVIQEISESFKHSDGKRHEDTGYGRLH